MIELVDMAKNILLIGLQPQVVDFSQVPGLTESKLLAGLDMSAQLLNSKGYQAEWCLVDCGPHSVDEVAQKLSARFNDVVVIGAGIRIDPKHLNLFELLINKVMELSPESKIAFNTQPFDVLESVQRWI